MMLVALDQTVVHCREAASCVVWKVCPRPPGYHLNTGQNARVMKTQEKSYYLVRDVGA